MTRDDPAPGAAADGTAGRRAAAQRADEHRDMAPVGEEPIELGELPHGADDPDPVERSAAGRGWRRALPRRYRLLAGVGLLAVGFAGGMVVQRGAGVLPDPTASPGPSEVASADVQVAVPLPTGVLCTARLAADPYAWHTMGTTRCVGTISRIHGARITLSSDRGGSVTFLVDRHTVLRGIDSVDDLAVGRRVTVRIGVDPQPAAGGGLPRAELVGAA